MLKKNFKYILLPALLTCIAVTSCNLENDEGPVSIPEATIIPNTTIEELKQDFWQDDLNYATEIGTRDDGSHYIIDGHVISSDEAGNIFKNIVIQDETGAIALSVDSYDLYVNYRRGQRIVMDVTGLQAGKYNGLMQLGEAIWYENGQVWETSYMAPAVFAYHAQLSGLPDVALIDTIEVNSFAELTTDATGLMKWQSQLVKLNDVKFEEGGRETFSTFRSSGVDRTITDSRGVTLKVRTSGYSDFWNKELPEGEGDIVCILGYYGTAGWQLSLIDYDGCMNFGNPTINAGTRDNPYTIAQAITLESNNRNNYGWVAGYIVGTVAPGIDTVTGDSDVEWGENPSLDNSLVVAPEATCRDISKCIVLPLPQGSRLQRYAAIKDNPDVLGRRILLEGTLARYLGTWGLTDNTGSIAEFEIEGIEASEQDPPALGESSENPLNVSQLQARYVDGHSTECWVEGYIVGWVEGQKYTEGCRFSNTGVNVSQTNILIAADPEEKDPARCVPVQLPYGPVRSALNLYYNPTLLGSRVILKGNIETYYLVAGFKGTSEYILP